jgi:hypothetical protein
MVWPVIGCRRGSLSHAMLPIAICPRTQRPRSQSSSTASQGSLRDSDASSVRHIQDALTAEFLRHAEDQQLQDIKAIFEHAGNSPESAGGVDAASVFVDIVNRRQDLDSLGLNLPYEKRNGKFKYADLITSISWELATNRDAATALEIESARNFVRLLETASTYEANVTQVHTHTPSRAEYVQPTDQLSVVPSHLVSHLSPALPRNIAASFQRYHDG